jgi:hypothetical protein
MLFNNPEIIHDGNDLRIGGVESDVENISYENYTLHVKRRMMKLVVSYVKSIMADGVDYQKAIKETSDLIYGYLYIPEKTYPDNEEGIVEEIISSREYQNWQTEIYYRFLNTHVGVTTVETAIPFSGKFHPNVPEEVIEMMKEEESLWVLLEGLSMANFND